MLMQYILTTTSSFCNSRVISPYSKTNSTRQQFSSEFLPIGVPMSSSAETSSVETFATDSSYATHDEEHPLESIFTATYIIFFLQFLCNPLIYVVSNPSYRRAYQKVLCPLKAGNVFELTTFRVSQTRDVNAQFAQYVQMLIYQSYVQMC